MSVIWIGFGFILGTVLGSFNKVYADRSLSKASFGGRSYCASCKKRLRWYDLFPVFSYLFLGGRCRYCQKKIGIDYLVVEVIMGILTAFLFWQTQFSFPHTPILPSLSLALWVLELFFKLFIISVVVILAITDLKKTLIPDRITYPSITIAFLYIELLTLFKLWLFYYSLTKSEMGRYFLPPTTPYQNFLLPHWYDTLQPFLGSLIAAILVGLFFLTLIVVTRGRGMGGGDLKLGIFLGLAFGFPQALLAIMLAFVTGSIGAIALIFIRRKKFGQTIAFGPYLSLGAILTLFWAPQIMKWLNWS